MAQQVQFYCDDIRVAYTRPIPLASFLALGGVRSRHNRYDSLCRLGGVVLDNDRRDSAVYPVTRTIYYSATPSLHKCDGRCRNATGHDCECSCGGSNHGLGN